jgi:hypothetical protein
MKVIVIASPAASPLKKSSRLPEVTSSSAAAMIRWNTSSDEKRSRTASPTAGAPLRERSTTSRIESSSGRVESVTVLWHWGRVEKYFYFRHAP